MNSDGSAPASVSAGSSGAAFDLADHAPAFAHTHVNNVPISARGPAQPDMKTDLSHAQPAAPSLQLTGQDAKTSSAAHSLTDTLYTVATGNGLIRIYPPSVIPRPTYRASRHDFVQRYAFRLCLRAWQATDLTQL